MIPDVLSKVKGHYFLIVEAWDGAVDPRRSRLTLSVTVLDVDDNSPVFEQRSYNISIPENSPKDKVILHLRVSGVSPCERALLSLDSVVVILWISFKISFRCA